MSVNPHIDEKEATWVDEYLLFFPSEIAKLELALWK